MKTLIKKVAAKIKGGWNWCKEDYKKGSTGTFWVFMILVWLQFGVNYLQDERIEVLEKVVLYNVAHIQELQTVLALREGK